MRTNDYEAISLATVQPEAVTAQPPTDASANGPTPKELLHQAPSRTAPAAQPLRDQFEKHKASFLGGKLLRDWEFAALRSYGITAQVRQSLGLFFVLLALNGVGRLVLMGNVSPDLQASFLLDLSGFLLVGVLALFTFFIPRWWMVLATALAIFPFALGVLTGLMAIGLLGLIPLLKRANRELYLSGSDLESVKESLVGAASGQEPDLWPEIGRFANKVVRVRFYENAAFFLLGNKLLNTVPAADAGKCVVEVTRSGKQLPKKWPVQGKVKRASIALTDLGQTQLKEWLTKAATC